MSVDDSLASLPPTAPGGGEFGAPVTNRTDTVDESNIGGPSRLKLKVRPSPPQYPYADTFFALEVYVVDQHESLQRGEELPLNVTLSHYVSNAPAAAGTLVMQPTTCVIDKSGKCAIRMKIADDTASMERRRFRIKVEAAGRQDIEPALTEKLTVIRNRLEIRENPDNPVPDQWYKDEGGRENCVELQVHLLGPSGDEVKSRRVPLRLVLMYDNMHRVQNQEILKLSPDSKLVIDEHGKATLRVRIEEVSKNHQKQAFRIKVEPDVQEQPMSMDISSVVSKPITVLSKRINKPKGKRANPMGGSVKRAPDPGYVTGISTVDQSSLERRVNFSELISPSTGPVDTTNVSLYEALKSVIEWTGQVVNGLQEVQWQLLGYESKADGQPDHGRPLYSMKNPNRIVNSIVRRYATDTMANLHVLLKRIEAGSFDDPATGAGGAAGSAGTPSGAGGGGGAGGAGQSRTSSPSTPVPGGMHHPTNNPPPHNIGPPGAPGQPWEGPPGPSMPGVPPPRGMPSRPIPGMVRGRDERMMPGGAPGPPGHMLVGPGPMAGGGGGGAGPGTGPSGPGQHPPNKRARVGSGNGNASGNGVDGAGGGGAGGYGQGGSTAANGGGGGGSGGGGGAGAGGPGGRSTPSQSIEDGPPSIPVLNSTMSQMIVTRTGTSAGERAGAGGEGGARRGMGERAASFPFGAQMTSFDGAGGAGGGAPSRLERSLPSGLTDPTEGDVFFILAKGYLSHELGMLGFPAYDRNQLLLGFYKEIQSQVGQTQVVFIPAHRISNLDERDTAATTEILREEMKKGSQSIISYDNCNGMLEKMREDAFMYYWSKSMIIDMESNESPEQPGGGV